MGKLKALWRNNRGFMFFMGFMLVFRSAVADWNYVPSSSMNPTLVAGDRVVVNKLAYSLRVPFTLEHVARWSEPQPGDVVTFDSPRDEINLIKRVIAVGGDAVEMRDNSLVINGRVIDRTLLEEVRLISSESGLLRAQIWRETIGSVTLQTARLPQRNRHRDFPLAVIPKGQMLVLGDSRDNSADSRFIGLVDINRVTGRATRVAMSHNDKLFYLPRTDRFWLPLDERS
jgi:signal peptidase I